MKEVKESRFGGKKPEKIRFPARSGGTEGPERETERMSERSNERKGSASAEPELTIHLIHVPADRRIRRHTFDIYDDQLTALKAIQRAETDADPQHKEPTLGQLTQQALDDFIHKRAAALKNVKLRNE